MSDYKNGKILLEDTNPSNEGSLGSTEWVQLGIVGWQKLIGFDLILLRGFCHWLDN